LAAPSNSGTVHLHADRAERTPDAVGLYGPTSRGWKDFTSSSKGRDRLLAGHELGGIAEPTF
jgi:hypothetical protein